MSRGAKSLLLVLGAVAAAAMLLIAGGASYEVLDRGRLLEVRPDLDVLRVELLGAELYLPEALESWADGLNGLVLAALAAIGGFAASLFGPGGTVPDRRYRRLFALVALGGAAVALDELLELSEAVQLNVEAELGEGGVSTLVGEIDALIYLGLAVAFVVGFRDLILGSRRGVAWLGLGAALSILSFGLDVVDAPSSEGLEVVASACLLVGFTRLALERLE